MRYENICPGSFIQRLNRFVAEVEIDAVIERCHVKNTGRCKELLIEGAKVFVQKAKNPERKTPYDLISVYKGETLVNIDSQAPNQVFLEWVKQETFFKNITYIKPECRYQQSRFDFYLEADGEKIFVETKGVTLEEDGVFMFPDAPTERGVKHLNELADAVANGYQGYVFFVAQMQKGRYFTPNLNTHPEFASALQKAVARGVGAYCVYCDVKEDELTIDGFMDIKL